MRHLIRFCITFPCRRRLCLFFLFHASHFLVTYSDAAFRYQYNIRSLIGCVLRWNFKRRRFERFRVWDQGPRVWNDTASDSTAIYLNLSQCISLNAILPLFVLFRLPSFIMVECFAPRLLRLTWPSSWNR